MCKREDHRQRPGVYTPNYIFLEIKLLVVGCSFWLFSDFRCDVPLFIVILVTYKNIKKAGWLVVLA